MSPTEINLFDIVHVKVDFILLQKMYVILSLGRFIWTSHFVQCAYVAFNFGNFWTNEYKKYFLFDMVCLSDPFEKPNCAWPALRMSESQLFFLHSKEKSRLKSTFLSYHVKKHHSTLKMDPFKIMLLLSYLASLDNKPRTWF